MARRRRGLPPGTERRASGSYRIRLSIPNGDGTYRRPSITVNGSVSEVWDVFNAVDDERQRGGTIDTTITVAEWRDRWLSIRKRSVGSPATFDADMRRTRFFADQYGNRPLRSITTDDVDDHYEWLTTERAVSPATVRGYHRVLHKWFADASRHITFNPVTDATIPRVIRTRRDVWGPTQVAAFLAGTDGDRMFPWWHVALHTGVRREELIGIEWADLDDDTLTIRRRVVQTGSTDVTVLDATKNGAAIRRIVMDPDTVEVLDRQRTRQRADFLQLGSPWTPDTRIVVRPDGEPYRPRSVSQRWRRDVDRLGIDPVIPLGRARHSWGTIALSAGEPIHVVADRLGHSTAVLLNNYAQPTDDTDRRIASVVSSAIQSKR